MSMRKTYTPSEKDLRTAWRLKKNKKTIVEISEKLKITPGQYRKHLSVFSFFYEQQKKSEKFQKDLKTPGKGVKKKVRGTCHKHGEVKLRPQDIDLEVLKSYVICGFTRERIAELLGICRGTLWKLMKESEDIKYVMTQAKEDAAADIVRSGLMRLCKDHSVKDTHFASFQGDIYSKEYYKVFRPHLGAIKYLLANTIGWQNETKPQPPNNKGAILRMMDEVANHEDGVGPVDENTDQKENTPV